MDAETELQDLRERIGALEKAVFIGNGHPPLLSRAENVETHVKQLQADIASIKGSQQWAVRLILGQIAAYLISVAVRLLPMIGK